MMLFNSLTKSKQEFTPLNKKIVGVYTCGPTVYDYVTIGNWRTYVLGDVVVRALKYLGYNVDYVMNITDVGHLTGDNLGDADTGEDRLEKAAKKEGKTAWDIAKFYAQDFADGYGLLNLTWPTKPQPKDDRVPTDRFSKATDHILEQIALVEKIEAKGFTYRIDDGIYFDTKAYEQAGNIYGQLSNIDQVKEGARVEPNPQKKNPRDFALWKFSQAWEKRHMEWDSPWGRGFPGWHIECSAMGMKYLGEQFDIHVGGEDLKSTHHPNEVAQSEAATGKKPFVSYWIHGAFLRVDGKRMGKSLGNAYTLTDIVSRGFSPLDLKYFYYSGHYRKPLNFTWEGLEAAQRSLKKLVKKLFELDKQRNGYKDDHVLKKWDKEFQTYLSDDLVMPKLLALVWKLIDNNGVTAEDKIWIIYRWDKVFGFNLAGLVGNLKFSDSDAEALLEARELARKEKNFKQADELRKWIENLGYVIDDTLQGSKLRKK